MRFQNAEAKSFSGSGPYVIGRGPQSDVIVDDVSASRKHGILELIQGVWWFVDVSSTGTFTLDGLPVTEIALQGPTTLRLGGPDGSEISFLLPTHGTPNQAWPQPVASTLAVPQANRVLIGRGLDCNMVIVDLTASRHHAELRRYGNDQWELCDLGSANGTFVNGVRVDRCSLSSGSRVSIGSTSLIFDQGQLRLLSELDAATLQADHLSVTTQSGLVILSDVSVEAERGSFTAIVGPSGAGKSTLLKVLTGLLPPSGGTVRIVGEDLYENYEHLRSHVGYVPQEDIVHPQLTVRECLNFGAELRFPEEVGETEREEQVNKVLRSLGLLPHSEKLISKLSGGQRKRVSVALELLTEPDLLFLDEPTTGLDPGYEQSTMELLRELADQGRTVVVVTHAVSSLNLCDQVVFLGTGGWVGYVGQAESVAGHFGVDGYPAVFRLLESSGPQVLANAIGPPPTVHNQPSGNLEEDIPYPNGFFHQFSTLMQRQIAILKSDQRGLVVMALAAFVPAALLAALISGNSLSFFAENKTDGRTLLGAMVVTIGVIGVANGVREIVKEMPMYQRERAAGLRRTAYLLSKIVVFGVITSLQAVVLVIVATARAGGPGYGNMLPGRIELMVDLSLTGIAALSIGLLVSALVTTSEKAVATIPIMFVVLWLFSGTVANLAERPVLREVALLSPSNWGMAASASTSNLLEIEACGQVYTSQPGADAAAPQPEIPCPARWEKGFFVWLFDLTVLVLLTAVCLLAADVALARKEPLPHMRKRHIAGTAYRSVVRYQSKKSVG